MCLDDTTWLTTTLVGDVEAIQIQHQYLANKPKTRTYMLSYFLCLIVGLILLIGLYVAVKVMIPDNNDIYW
jgi:hypothetical protein